MATTIDYDGDPENPVATILRGMNDYQEGVTTMPENPSGTIDYHSLTREKLCPLKATRSPVLGFWNLDPAPDLSATLAVRATAPLRLVEWAGVDLCPARRSVCLCAAFGGVGI